MALPKEPRQKMINLMYLVLTALLAINLPKEILNGYKVVDKSLNNSSENINKANGILYNSLESKLHGESSAQAAIWNPRALEAKKLSDEINNYVNSLKDELKKEAAIDPNDASKGFKEDNLDASTRMFENNKKGEELQAKLTAYRAAMLAISPEIGKEFEATLPIDVSDQVGEDGVKKSFTQFYFDSKPTVASLTMLSKFQNNIKNAENQVTGYCQSQVGQVQVHMDQVGVLVGQSSNYLMPGQELTVTAGVGAYSSKAAPSISINGSGVPVSNGQGSLKLTANGAGEHSVNVSVNFKDENGQPKTLNQTIKYTVGTPGGAAVMLDKMNVMYIGVDNPVTISSGAGWDKTSVSMSGGTLSGSNGNRTARVSSVGTASITVNADGKTSTFPFRIKRIPDPVFKVGSGKSRMPTVEFKGQQFCRADLENFDFDLKYSVVSATVYFSGAGFPNAVQVPLNSNSLGNLAAQIARCQPGSSVSFEGIKVQGPDGVRGIDGRSFQLY